MTNPRSSNTDEHPRYERQSFDDGQGFRFSEWPAVFILLLIYPFAWIRERFNAGGPICK